MVANYQAQTTVGEIRRTRGWNKHQYNRFRDAVIDEGKELLLGEAYWLKHPKPKVVLWRHLTNGVVQDILKNLRGKLVGDDLESKMPLDDNVLRWKLLPWLRDNQHKIETSKPQPSEQLATARESDAVTKTGASNESVSAMQPGIAQEPPCEDAASTRPSRSLSFFDPIKDALHQ